MSAVYSAVALIYTGGSTQHMSWLQTSQSVFTAIGSGTVGIISVSFLIFLVSLGALWVFHNKTYNGRAISYTGGNKVAAELSGIPIKRSVVLIYTICGLMSAIGAVVLFSRITTAAPIIGKNYETNAILRRRRRHDAQGRQGQRAAHRAWRVAHHVDVKLHEPAGRFVLSAGRA